MNIKLTFNIQLLGLMKIIEFFIKRLNVVLRAPWNALTIFSFFCSENFSEIKTTYLRKII